jgi:hypothetical protein
MTFYNPTAISQTRRSLLAWWRDEVHRRFLDVLRVAWPLRAILFMAGLTLVVLVLPDQIAELLRMLVLDKQWWWRIPVFFILLIISSVSLWYWARTTLRLCYPGYEIGRGEDEFLRRAVRWLPRVLGSVPLLAAAAALFWAVKGEAGGSAELNWWLNLLGLICVLLVPLLWISLYLRRRHLDQQSASASNQQAKQTYWFKPSNLDPKYWKWMWKWAVIAVVCTTILTLFPLQASAYLGSTTLILLWIASLTFLLGMLAFFGTTTGVPLLLFLISLMVVFSGLDLNDNHGLREVPLAGKSGPIEAREGFKDWLAARADRQDDKFVAKGYPVFLVAAEGGGIRAAYLTSLVLATLQDHCPRFAQHTFAISGVSGGSLGAAIFGALAADYASNTANLPCAFGASSKTSYEKGQLATRVDQVLQADLLAPALASGLYRDLLQRFLPWPFESWSRARILEDAVEKSWQGALGEQASGRERFGQGFQVLAMDLEKRAVPALLLNTTEVVTGERMVVSHLTWTNEEKTTEGAPGQPTTSDAPRNGNKPPYRPWLLQDYAPGRDVPLKTAAFLSARFPYVTPVGTIKDARDPRVSTTATYKAQFADGGYFDNSGGQTIVDLIKGLGFDSSSEPESNSTPNVRPVIIRIENGEASTSARSAVTDEDEESALPRYDANKFSETLSPVRTLLNVRTAHAELAKRQTEALIEELKRRGFPGADVVTVRLRPGAIPLPLGWVLSQQARQEISDQLSVPEQCDNPKEETNGCALGKIVGMLQGSQ